MVDVLQSKQRETISMSLTGRLVIDYIFVSRDLAKYIVNKGYNKFDQLQNTDHHGMFLNMDTNQLFGNGDMQSATKALRSNHGRDPHNVKLYVECMWQYLEEQ
eukprot:607471-Ditylum_brightwellii.AAC.1